MLRLISVFLHFQPLMNQTFSGLFKKGIKRINNENSCNLKPFMVRFSDVEELKFNCMSMSQAI